MREKIQRNTGAIAVELCGDPVIEAKIHILKEKRNLICRLVEKRIEKKIDQWGISKLTNIPEQRIIEIESGYDENMLVSELYSYSKAVGFKVSITLE